MTKNAPAETLMSSDAAKALTVILDDLIPGDDGRWPRFSAVVPVPGFVDGLDPDLRRMVTAFSASTAEMTKPDRIGAIAAWERSGPQVFSALLGAVHRAYYSSSAVSAIVANLADAGPREKSAHFDPRLVETAVATGAGRRRL
jgi:hypothetical protein